MRYDLDAPPPDYAKLVQKKIRPKPPKKEKKG